MKLFKSFLIGLFTGLLSFGSYAQQSISYTYNSAGQVLTEDGPRTDVSDITTNTYDSQGNRATKTNALGKVTRFTDYDASGNLLSMIDPNGVVTEFTYHERGWLLTSIVKHPTNIALDVVTTYSYDEVGLLIGSTLSNGASLHYEYDDARRLVAVSNTLNERIEYTLDAAGNRTQQIIKNSSGSITYSIATIFDELSRVMQVLGNNGQKEIQTYDANDNLITTTDGRSNTTRQTYDAINRVKKIIDPAAAETQFFYNVQNQIETIIDARGNMTTYRYDGFGNLVSQASPDTGTTTFTYDAAGNRTSSTDARGVVTNYTYDALNRLTAIKYPTAPAENISFVYDTSSSTNFGIGRLSRINKTGVNIAYLYDYLGRVIQKDTTPNGVAKNIKYSYDKAGNITRIIYPSLRSVDYSYDSLGRLTGLTTKLGSTSAQTIVNNISYLPFGPASSYRYGNGLTHSLTFDQDYRLTNVQVGGVLSRSYGYDPVNNITSIVNTLNSSKNQAYTYDALNRLITASGSYGNLGYTYDTVGNRLSETRNGSSSTYIYSRHMLTSIYHGNGNRNFAYDAAGNPTTRTADNNSTQSFTFNNANRLTSVNVNGALSATYLYNPLGQRVMKTLANGTKEIYHYDEAGQLISVTNAAGATLREYIYWNDQQIAFINNGTLYYVHNDHLNTPQVITNQSQQVVWMGDYEPFGKLAANANNNIEIFSRFPGQYVDLETGLYYNYFRDYDPSIGRYIESDPIGLLRDYSDPILDLSIELGVISEGYFAGEPINHLYGYVGQAPTYWYDPFGLAEHTNNARPSTKEKHQNAETRRNRDRGGEKGDKNREAPRKRPPGHKGPWPVRLPIPLVPQEILDRAKDPCFIYGELSVECVMAKQCPMA